MVDRDANPALAKPSLLTRMLIAWIRGYEPFVLAAERTPRSPDEGSRS